ncbi:hypothetical protein FNV43_RR16551 [Rhamnella rubrinervis]|uniref:Protein PHOTOPERIOD-INDEPENDENT EARLY FLOWERING 1 n=1 Tax=Rhamnella rubrinervis TaxID=2594499 RepID=A0A8K0GZ23_9ROSA|nr:hypothetical protein FNV43_RR16551 [Rhamnella rubrinervis]
MASKGPRSKLDHETRAKRQKALEAPREPRRPKAHWDHVLEEMVWLSKDFESERKWKLNQAKKVALRASKGMLDQATRGEKKMKEEEQRLKKVALNISKDVKKFWLKIEKLVLYKHQMELDEKKKKALDKQLEFLLGQTERYSTMLAENLVDNCKPAQQYPAQDSPSIQHKEVDRNDNNESTERNAEPQADSADVDEDYDMRSDGESEDDEHTIEEDEALITVEERQEELAALHSEIDLPLEELLKRYTRDKGNENEASRIEKSNSVVFTGRRCGESNGALLILENHLSEIETSEAKNLPVPSMEKAKEHVSYDFNDEEEDGDFVLAAMEEKDDETTMSEEEELAKVDSNDPMDEIALLQKESEIPIEELLARYKKDYKNNGVVDEESEYASALSDGFADSPSLEDIEQKQQFGSVNEDAESSEHQPDVNSIIEEEQAAMESESRIADAAAAARSAQPTGNTFSTTNVRTKFPFLLKFSLREYQHIGLDWLVTMYEKRLNGILADEMGLGKTIMTIALLAHLACEKGIWGPHLIVVPTSVMLNWETEFLKWCPAFKILTYFGTAKERKLKRQGWLKPNSFHVCITTYRLVIQDSKVFKRKKWKYLILDEAHLIKNWKSQRWQTLLNFNSKRRILLTGTPLQNDLMELWSLMHFLMPHIFQSHQEFKDWFCNPISGMVEGQEKVNKEVVDRLHNVLRPFLLRRLKRDVEKQLPMKHEHVIYCRLSRRQRNLYEDFIASSETQATLASANFFGMISVIMQLRKVCNHPDLFEGRPIVSSYDMGGMDIQLCSSICSILSPDPISRVDLRGMGFLFTHLDYSMTSWESDEVKALAVSASSIMERADLVFEEIGPGIKHRKKLHGTNIFEEIQKAIFEERLRQAKEQAEAIAWWNSLRCDKKPTYSTTLRDLVTVKHPVHDIHCHKTRPLSYVYSSKLADIILSPVERFQKMIDLVESFMFAIPAARAPTPVFWCSKPGSSVPAIVRRQVYFPDRRLIQFDCGKLQELSILLRKLKSEGHRALIFTQMTKMLDILEAFINLYGYTYMRLDGSTQPEERQTLMQRFNTNPKIFLFILSTRSGGVGINLVGADTVIFYDSDWNPAMDQQAQDRCHRIGQTREVHIYRLISDSTIEENILKKANQKRALDDLVIQSGGYNTEFLKKLDPMELFSGHRSLPIKSMKKEKNYNGNEVSVSNDDVEAALKHAEDEADYMALKKVEQEEAVDNQEFTEEAIGRLEDDELVNEDDVKVDEPADQGGWMVSSNKESGMMLNGSDSNEEKALSVASGREDDVDMLADVKQMAEAAAAAGQAILSFENQLRPIDRYAVRFLELWDPIIDKAAVESQARFEETEWELDRIERYKEEMEAEIDEDEEPFIYERWDADFATEAYRQQVEALAQHQLMEELECEARERENEEDENDDSMKNEMPYDPKPKAKKKAKKAKFKSLKKRSLASELKCVKEEPLVDAMSMDEENVSHEAVTCSDWSMLKKRKKAEITEDSEGEKISKKKSKKFKKALFRYVLWKIPTPLACSMSLWIQNYPRVCLILSINQLAEEDAILCAVVHEYGPHWSLVSEILYGMTAGGFYRGRYRHPVHCCERFRELIQRYVLSTPDNPNYEKVSYMGSGKALLKVTEDNIRMLLDVAAEQPDGELLLQKHFTALLTSIWKMTSRIDSRQNHASSRNGFSFGGRFFTSANQNPLISMKEPAKRLNFINLGHVRRFLASALHDASSTRQDDRVHQCNRGENNLAKAEQLELTLEFQREMDDSLDPMPSVLNLSVIGSDSLQSTSKDVEKDHHLRSSCDVSENRFRSAARACVEDNLGWATSVFPTNDVRSRSASKVQLLGKHKLPVSELSKPSKSKLKRTSMEHGEMSHAIADRVCLQLPAAAPMDLDQRFDLNYSPVGNDVQVDDFNSTSHSYIDEEFLPDMEGLDGFEVVPHSYVPGVISGLDEFSSLPKFTDKFTDIAERSQMADKLLNMKFKHCFIVIPRHVVDWTRHFQRVNQNGSDLALGAYSTLAETCLVEEESELRHAQ